MAKFRKKPVVIEAVKFTGINEMLHDELNKFVGSELDVREYNNFRTELPPI